MDKLYNVYDTEDECYIMLGSTMTEVRERFLTTTKKVSQYVCEGYKMDNRYLIYHADEQSQTKVPEWLSKQWGEIKQAAEAIKNGGHIRTIYHNGKYIHYTEARK